MAIADLDTMNAAALGMSPNDYKVMKQKKDQIALAQNSPSVSWLPDSVPTQSDINAQSLSADQAPQASEPQPTPPQAPSNNISMPNQNISALAPDQLSAPDFSGQQQTIGDMKDALQKYLAQPEKLDLTPLASLVDAWAPGSKFAANYKAPLSEEDKQLNAAKLRNYLQQAQTGLSTEQIKYLNAKATAQNTKDYHDQLIEAKKWNAQALKDKQAADEQFKWDNSRQKAENQLTDALNGYKGRAGELGSQQQIADRAIHLKQFAASNPDLNLTGPATQEFATGLDALLKGGNSTAVNSIKELVPHTYTGDVAGVMQWISDKPQGREQQDFIKKMIDQIDRQGKTAEEIIKKAQGQVLSKGDIIKQYDKKYGTTYYPDLLQRNGVDESQFKNGQYQMNLAPVPNFETPKAGQVYSDGQGGFVKYNGQGDPNDTKNYTKVSGPND